jgi:ADP-glucose pyrophosphorylase
MHARSVPAETLVGANADVHPGAAITNSIIGADVKIPFPIQVSDSIIFSGTRIASQRNLQHCIITPNFHLECGHELSLAAGRVS